MKPCPKFTFGVGDRFAHSAQAQLQAFIAAKELGIEITPVWNKSNREHDIIGSEPQATRAAADLAVKNLGWDGDYLLDADHINLGTVDRFIAPCDFFTLDVAEDIGEAADPEDITAFIRRHPELIGTVSVEGIEQAFEISREDVEKTAMQFLRAIQKAKAIYDHIAAVKGKDFVTEISMDETDEPQTATELLVILAAVADQGVPIQTIAPKFTGRFNKGVDYVGDVAQFEKEFNDDLAVIAHAVRNYGLPETLKLSVHSGSDKFSIYAPIKRALARTGAGLHIKTAGTSWLEEVIGLAEAGGRGLELAKMIYIKALEKKEALCEPYATVIDIDYAKLPTAEEVNGWTSEQFTGAVRHIPGNPLYNANVRQLLHVGFKVAAQLGESYLSALKDHREVVSRCVTENLLERHMKPLFQ
ncbi:tagaturonate epimerase family protein [Haloferula chungangensis]|uniref:Tagaturonate/fructuronate epimerase n=1 Tax=Haloferula chungangensis TaxID=1048331 RepID=A0ABW2LAH4_9BACT